MKKLRKDKIIQYVIRLFFAFMCLVILLLLSMSYFPKTTSNILKVYIYPNISEGTNESISKNSLVVSIVNENIKVDNLVTFETDRFGKKVILTQNIAKTYTTKDGDIYYKTSNGNERLPEEYLVKQEQVIGSYLFHIPYLGYIMTFMKSKYMLILVLCIIQVFLFMKLKKETDKEKSNKKKVNREYLMINNMCIEHIDNEMMISGTIENHLHQSVKCVIAQLDLYDKNNKLILNEQWNILNQKTLPSGQKVNFSYKVPYVDNVVDYGLRIRKYKH